MAPKAYSKAVVVSTATATGNEAKLSKTAGEKAKPEATVLAKVSHPSYTAMVKKALEELGDKKGSSRQAILKFITERYSLASSANRSLNISLNKLLEEGEIVRGKGSGVVSGANGRFKMAAAPKLPAASAQAGKKPAAVPKAKTAAESKKTTKEVAGKAGGGVEEPEAKKSKKSGSKPDKKVEVAAAKGRLLSSSAEEEQESATDESVGSPPPAKAATGGEVNGKKKIRKPRVSIKPKHTMTPAAKKVKAALAKKKSPTKPRARKRLISQPLV